MKVPRYILTLIVIVVVLGAAISADARVWRVALDGSGDTSSIQEAGQLADSGDTISIAPGRYSDLVDHFDGFSTRKVIAAFEGDKELTLIGDDRESVIIGPLVFEFAPPDSPIGIYWRSTRVLHAKGLQIVNSNTALRSSYSPIDVQNCKFRGNYQCVTSHGGGTNRIDSCLFEGTTDNGGTAPNLSIWTPGADSCLVIDCELLDSGRISFDSVSWGEVRDCRIDGFYTRYYLSSGIIDGCDLGSFASIEGSGASGVEIRDNVFLADADVEFGINAYGAGTSIEIYGNIFEGGTARNISMINGASISGFGNHIFHQPGTYAVQLENYPIDSTAVVDLRGNFWGTTEADSVAAWIYDVHDAECDGYPTPPDVCTEVLYLPIEPNPVPEEKTSLGGLKALFR